VIKCIYNSLLWIFSQRWGSDPYTC
jgi:hypothetical protein